MKGYQLAISKHTKTNHHVQLYEMLSDSDTEARNLTGKYNSTTERKLIGCQITVHVYSSLACNLLYILTLTLLKYTTLCRVS